MIKGLNLHHQNISMKYVRLLTPTYYPGMALFLKVLNLRDVVSPEQLSGAFLIGTGKSVALQTL